MHYDLHDFHIFVWIFSGSNMQTLTKMINTIMSVAKDLQDVWKNDWSVNITNQE